MLDVLISVAEAYPNPFRPYVSNLDRSLGWAEQNLLVRRTGRHTLTSWRSNHLLIRNGPEAWSTAAVFQALRRFDKLVSSLLQEDILAEFKAIRIVVPNPSKFQKLSDSDLLLANNVVSLKTTLRKHLIDPHIQDVSPDQKRFSAIFFGPPGTAKTSLAEAIAYAVGWPYIYLQTSDFLSEGFGLATGRARYIFERLRVLQRAVILFDEVEEFVRDREEKDLETQSRLVTTTMLTLIQDLRQRSSTIFILATNRLSAFDAAVKRPGRFDLILLISPPSLVEKQRMFEEVLSKQFTGKDAAVTVFNDVTKKLYDNPIQFFSYLEWKSFLAAVVDQVTRKGALDERDLEATIKSHAESLTIVGGLREAYLQSKKFSRIY